LLRVLFRQTDNLHQRLLELCADLLQAGYVDIGFGILQLVPDFIGVLSYGPLQVDWRVEMGPGTERLESLEGFFVVLGFQGRVLVVLMGQFNTLHGAVVQARIASWSPPQKSVQLD